MDGVNGARHFRTRPSVPPWLQVSFLKAARSVSKPPARMVILLCQKPARLKVQQPSPLSAVARVPNELRSLSVATATTPALKTYSALRILGCVHFRSRSIDSVIFCITHGMIVSLVNSYLLPRETAGIWFGSFRTFALNFSMVICTVSRRVTVKQPRRIRQGVVEVQTI